MATQTATEIGSSCKLFIKDGETKYGDFRDDLVRDGFAVVKGAIPRKRAEKYADQIYTWLEDL